MIDPHPPQPLPDLADTWQKTLGWQPTPAQNAKLQQLYEHILAGNRQLNLTRITEPMDFWEKHLWDSLRGIRHWLAPGKERDAVPEDDHPPPPPLAKLPDNGPIKVIDIGTGAGFPGVPIAIVQPTWAVTLLDSTRKKMQFLNTLLEELDLPNVNTLTDRVEAVGQHRQHRQRYDLALIRAVAPAAVCAEYALPLLRSGGIAVLYRGQWTSTETTDLESIVNLLGGTIATVEDFQTPLTGSDRACLYLQKTAHTPPEFPRAIGIPTQKPLA